MYNKANYAADLKNKSFRWKSAYKKWIEKQLDPSIYRTGKYYRNAENYLKAKILINKALSDTFFDKKIGLFRSFNDRRTDEYSMLTNSLCLLCGAAENLDKTEILKVLTFENDKKAVKIIPNTISMNCFRFDALLKENREKYAPIILDEIDRTYLTMLREGATAFWETAKGYEDFEGAASLCHGWSALPVYYYSVLE